MPTKVKNQQLKYSIRERYIAFCARTGKQPDFADFYQSVASGCGVSFSRIRRITLAKRDELTTAAIAELTAFAELLGCSVQELANEAAERVVAP